MRSSRRIAWHQYGMRGVMESAGSLVLSGAANNSPARAHSGSSNTNPANSHRIPRPRISTRIIKIHLIKSMATKSREVSEAALSKRTNVTCKPASREAASERGSMFHEELQASPALFPAYHDHRKRIQTAQSTHFPLQNVLFHRDQPINADHPCEL